jgi:hypothetical protein
VAVMIDFFLIGNRFVAQHFLVLFAHQRLELMSAPNTAAMKVVGGRTRASCGQWGFR